MREPTREEQKEIRALFAEVYASVHRALHDKDYAATLPVQESLVDGKATPDYYTLLRAVAKSIIPKKYKWSIFNTTNGKKFLMIAPVDCDSAIHNGGGKLGDDA
jgi:hypothetical protein